MTVTLRFPEPRDVEPLFAAVRESIPELHPWAPWCPLTYGLADAARWVGQQPAAREAGTAFEFVVVDADGRILGCCGVNQINAGFRLGSLGYWVRSSAARRGVATAAARQAADALGPGYSAVSASGSASDASGSSTTSARMMPSRRMRRM